MEDVFIEDAEGRQLAYDLEQGTLKGYINLQGTLVDSKSIKAIIPNAGDPDRNVMKDRVAQEREEAERQFRIDRQSRWDMPPHVRAQNVKVAELMSVAVQDRHLTPEEIVEVIACQEKFFTDNPEYATANPICYKHVFKEMRQEKTTKSLRDQGMRHIADVLPLNVMAQVEQQVRNGIKGFTD